MARFGHSLARATFGPMSKDAANTDAARKRKDRTKRTIKILIDVRSADRMSIPWKVVGISG
jgi:hypothetical protein